MLKDLTSLKWRKNIYYVSDEVIFDICTKKKSPDFDDCGTYLIDMEHAPEEVKKAKDGSLLDLSNCVEVFAENVPYIRLVFSTTNNKELVRTFPLQYLIETGDKVIDGKAVQAHPDVFDGEYVNEFNYEVFDFILKITKNRADFDTKNVKFVMDSLPDWLTMGVEEKYMTESYIDRYFLKGVHYDSKLATKGAESADLYQYKGAYVGIGLDEEVGKYVPVNVWQKETVEKFLNASYAEKTINKYNKCVKTEFRALTVDTMENMAATLKDVELGFNEKNLKTFLNTEYDAHDCENVKFESVCCAEDVDTWYEYLKRKDEMPSLDVEELIAADKEFVEQYIQDNFEDPTSVVKHWWESEMTMSKFYTDPEAADNKVEKVVNVFTVYGNNTATVLMIYHTGDLRVVAEHKKAAWIEDLDLYTRSEELVKTFDEAYELMLASDYNKPHSRQCALRAAVGPHGATTPPQYIFGNMHTQLYVDAKTGTVLNYNPVFHE